MDPSLRAALNQSLTLALLTMLVATPIGVALAIGLARWRGRLAKPSNFLMLFPLVTPEIVMGVALFLVFDNLYDFVTFGTMAQFLGHVTFSISFVVIIVRAACSLSDATTRRRRWIWEHPHSKRCEECSCPCSRRPSWPVSPSSSPSPSTIL